MRLGNKQTEMILGLLKRGRKDDRRRQKVSGCSEGNIWVAAYCWVCLVVPLFEFSKI